MTYEIVMPQLSDSMEEGKLISWRVKEGDYVEKGDVIAEVESDKAIMEVQSFKAGKVEKLKVQEGESMPVGTVIATIDTEAETQNTPNPTRELPKSPLKTPTQKVYEEHVLKRPSQQKNEIHRSILDEILGLKETESLPTSQKVEGNASPKAKALAATYRLDIKKLQQEGKLPVPTHEKDIENYRLQHYFTPKALELLKLYKLDPTLFSHNKKHNSEAVMKYIEIHDIPLPKPIDTFQKALIHTVENAAKKPTYHLYDYINSSLILQHKEHTVTVWIIKLIAKAMMQHEVFRTTLKDESIILHPNASISLAVAYKKQLYMPVFKEANQKSTEEIARELDTFETKAKQGTMRSQEMHDSTFGISNLGMLGIERFDALINAEDSGIAAIGKGREGKISITLTLDHRLINGYQAAEFIQTLKELAEDEKIFKE